MKPTKAQVKALYKSGLSLRAIGLRFNVHGQTVLNWMEKWGLKRRPASNRKLWDSREEEIKYLYHTQRMSQEQIANYYKVSLSIIQRAMQRLTIQRRSRGRRGSEHHAYKHGKASTLYRRVVVKKECRQCRATKRLVIHHKNDDHLDNRLENLEILCESCHNSLSKKRWWARKRRAKGS